MKFPRRSAGNLFAALLCFANSSAQDVRRAQRVDEPPIVRALPAEDETLPPRRQKRAPDIDNDNEVSAAEELPNDKRQLQYANALFARKMYDLAIPEYEKYLTDYPTASGRAN